MVDTVQITAQQLQELRKRSENHFLDFKAKEVSPAKITKIVSAFQNADGGEVWVGLTDPQKERGDWLGYSDEEEANGLLQALETTFGIGNYLQVEFVACEGQPGLCVHLDVEKSHGVSSASDGTPYVRRGAQSLPCKDEARRRLELAKGITSQEAATLSSDPKEIVDSETSEEFIGSVVPSTTPERWMQKQRLIINSRPTVAGTLLFSDEPQISLPFATVKIARYNTSEEAAREFLTGVPETIEGPYTRLFGARFDELRRLLKQNL